MILFYFILFHILSEFLFLCLLLIKSVILVLISNYLYLVYSCASCVECDEILESQQLEDICNLLLFNRPNHFELLCQATSLIQVQWSLDWYPNSPHRFLIFFVSSHLLITVLLIRFFVSSTKNVSTLRRLMILRMGPKNPQ